MGNNAHEYELPVVNIRLVKEPSIISDTRIGSSEDAKEVIKELISDSDREMFCVLNMRTDGMPINMNVVSIGDLNSSLVNPREVFKSSILSNAAAVILFHNHPSGTIKPSREDYRTTERLVECGELIGIPVVDHIIVGAGHDRVYSFLSHGELHKSYNEICKERDFMAR